MDDPDIFLKQAKAAVADAWAQKRRTYNRLLPVELLYIVWFSKTLENWKALVSTDAIEGIYFEVTHNGSTGETYVDTYLKTDNYTYNINQETQNA